MTFYDMMQQVGAQNTPWGAINPQNVQPFSSFGQRGAQGFHGDGLGGPGLGLGQAAFGPQPFGQNPWGQTSGWGGANWGGPQRQLSPQDIAEVARQLALLMPQANSQTQQPLAAFGYAPYGQQQRLLTQQEINDIVRQILPMLPQIVGALQGYASPAAAFGQPLGGQSPFGAPFYGQNPYVPSQNPFMGQGPFSQPLGGSQPFGQMGWPGVQAAFGAGPSGVSPFQQRQLTPQDVHEVARQLAWIIPQTSAATQQPYGQQRMM